MHNLQQNKLAKIVKTRNIEDYKNISKENLLIALVKSNQNITELRRSKDNNSVIEEIRKIFNEQKNNIKN